MGGEILPKGGSVKRSCWSNYCPKMIEKYLSLKHRSTLFKALMVALFCPDWICIFCTEWEVWGTFVLFSCLSCICALFLCPTITPSKVRFSRCRLGGYASCRICVYSTNQNLHSHFLHSGFFVENCNF